MTEEELKVKLNETQAKLDAALKEADSLKVQRSNQNAYITKLEEKARSLESQTNNIKDAVSSVPQVDPEITKYFHKQMRKEITEEAKSAIVNSVGQDKYNLLEKELNEFINKYMTTSNQSVNYIVDAFHLLLGKAYADPSHPMNAKEEMKVIEKIPNNTGENAKALDQLNKMINTGMNNEDKDFRGVTPIVTPTQVNNTRDAMKSFKERLLNPSKFE